MSREELDAVAHAPRIADRPEAARKLNLPLWKTVRMVELAAEGQPWNKAFRTPNLPDGCIPAQVEVVIVHTGQDQQAEQSMIDLGLRATFTRGTPNAFAVGLLSPARVADLASLPYVVSVTSYEPVPSLELNDSIKSVRVDQVRIADTTATGAGVLIVIIDTGVDWKHGSFRLRKPNERTRIVGIWDQRRPAISGETPGPAPFTGQPATGVVYRRKDIDHSLGYPVDGPTYPPGPAVTVRHKDVPYDQSVTPFAATSAARKQLDEDQKHAHGTHVAGIAAGDGSPGSCCRPGGFRFVGMAPEAELLVVATGEQSRTNASVIKAFDWIESWVADPTNNLDPQNKLIDKPIVVNISDGFNLGAHDGTTPLEKRIERFLQPVVGQPTRVVVKSAGNEADTNRHVHDTVDAQGQKTLPLVVAKGVDTADIELWVAHNSGLEFELRVGSERAPQRISLATFDAKGPILIPASGSAREQTTFFWTANEVHSDNGQSCLALQIRERGDLASDDVAIEIFNPTATAVTFDAWIEKNGATGVHFQPNRATPDGTITIPGTAPNVIAVANGNGNRINPHSSRGPASGNAPPDRAKPTVTALGDEVKSAEADGRTCCVCLCGGPWTELHGGTSMSAPHVAGIVALMLQKNRQLSLADIHTILRTHTIEGDHGEPNKWGAGRVDGLAAWQAVTPAPPPSPQPIAPPPMARLASIAPTAPLDPMVAFDPVLSLVTSRPALAELAAVFSRHLSEVRRLINTNRRIATLWHRADGPMLLRRLGLGATDPAAPTPMRHAADREYLERMFGQLARYGSPRLQASLRTYGPRVLALLEQPLAATQLH